MTVLTTTTSTTARKRKRIINTTNIVHIHPRQCGCIIAIMISLIVCLLSTTSTTMITSFSPAIVNNGLWLASFRSSSDSRFQCRQNDVIHLPMYCNSNSIIISKTHDNQQRCTTTTKSTFLFSSVTPSSSSTTTASAATENDTTSNGFAMKYSYIADTVRKDFEILDRTIGGSDTDDDTNGGVPLVYLDSAATSQKPLLVVNKLNQYYTQTNSNVHRGAHTLSQQATYEYECARTIVQEFIGASKRTEIIFTSGATDSINLICHSYGRTFLHSGDEIILTVAEHHSNLVPWQILANDMDLILKYVAIDPQTGCMDLQHLQTLLSPKTKIVSFQHVSNVLGCINPVQEIVQMIRTYNTNHNDNNAVIVLDACQSVPHMPVNVQELDIDFMVASGHKMCGPTGIGFLYGKETLLNAMTPYYKGGGEMIDIVSLVPNETTYQESPGRHEAGTPPIAQAIGLGCAIQYLQQIGIENIEQYEYELGTYLYQQLCTIPGITILGPVLNNNDTTTTTTTTTKRAALCAFTHESVHPSDIATFLDLEGIAIRAGHHCCQPLHDHYNISHSARASLYFYNTKEEIDFFIQELRKTIDFFTSSSNMDEIELLL